ncbi:MAG: peptidylprolyl isomerase [Candidatus Lernaella stagnicola]|nr:peptidylprolyl isomerase [Candidatus Lernaella stagnicola]
MSEVKNGDTVKVHYTGTLDDGSVFDTSQGGDPLEFTIGEGQIIPGFEEIVVGMDVGETRTGMVPSDKAYGPHRPEGVVSVDRSVFPPDIDPEVDQVLAVQGDGGERIPVRVTAVTEAEVTLDQNHPMAGKDLNFEIEVLEVS